MVAVELLGGCHRGPCPSQKDGECKGDWSPGPLVRPVDGRSFKTCATWWCTGCEQWRPWCHGASDSMLCDTCEAKEKL